MTDDKPKIEVPPVEKVIEDAARRLIQFYDDPGGRHPGLSTWCEAESNLLWALSGALRDAGISEQKEAPEIPPKKERQFEGANWVEKSMRAKNMSRLGRKVADVLGVVYAGIYHIDQKALDKVDWSHNGWIEIKLRDSLSTWDFNRLTALVFACHDAAVRVEIDGNSWHMLMLRFHERKREGGMAERHPTVEHALAIWREHVAGTLMYEHGEPKERS